MLETHDILESSTCLESTEKGAQKLTGSISGGQLRESDEGCVGLCQEVREKAAESLGMLVRRLGENMARHACRKGGVAFTEVCSAQYLYPKWQGRGMSLLFAVVQPPKQKGQPPPPKKKTEAPIIARLAEEAEVISYRRTLFSGETSPIATAHFFGGCQGAQNRAADQ